MKISRTWIRTLGMAALIGAALPACVVRGQARFTTGAMVVHEQPPPPRQESYETRSGFIWVAGRWNYQGNQWVWAPGHYERERANQVWIAGEWTRRGDSWHWVEGHWEVSGTVTTVTPVNDGGRPQVVDHRTPQPQPIPNPGGMYPTAAPPPPRNETYGNRVGFIWVAGHWNWQNGGYAWIDGHWERERANQRWTPGRWDFNGSFYVWIDGSWN